MCSLGLPLGSRSRQLQGFPLPNGVSKISKGGPICFCGFVPRMAQVLPSTRHYRGGGYGCRAAFSPQQRFRRPQKASGARQQAPVRSQWEVCLPQHATPMSTTKAPKRKGEILPSLIKLGRFLLPDAKPIENAIQKLCLQRPPHRCLSSSHHRSPLFLLLL